MTVFFLSPWNRLDSQNSLGYEWLFISWIPESSTVRDKMIYASTKATMKSQFGTGQIKEDLHATLPVSLPTNKTSDWKPNQNFPNHRLKWLFVVTNVRSRTKQHQPLWLKPRKNSHWSRERKHTPTSASTPSTRHSPESHSQSRAPQQKPSQGSPRGPATTSSWA